MRDMAVFSRFGLRMTWNYEQKSTKKLNRYRRCTFLGFTSGMQNSNVLNNDVRIEPFVLGIQHHIDISGKNSRSIPNRDIIRTGGFKEKGCGGFSPFSPGDQVFFQLPPVQNFQ